MWLIKTKDHDPETAALAFACVCIAPLRVRVRRLALVTFQHAEETYHQKTVVKRIGCVLKTQIPIACRAEVVMQHIDVKHFHFLHVNVVTQQIVDNILCALR